MKSLVSLYALVSEIRSSGFMVGAVSAPQLGAGMGFAILALITCNP